MGVETAWESKGQDGSISRGMGEHLLRERPARIRRLLAGGVDGRKAEGGQGGRRKVEACGYGSGNIGEVGSEMPQDTVVISKGESCEMEIEIERLL